MNREVNQGFKRTGRRFVEEVPYGMYVWEIEEDGETKILGDGDGNIMNVFCMKGDRKALDAITQAARHYGYPDGKAVWWSGKRPISDEEYEEQLARERMGLTPDPFDYAAIKDEERALRQNGR